MSDIECEHMENHDNRYSQCDCFVTENRLVSRVILYDKQPGGMGICEQVFAHLGYLLTAVFT